MFENGGSSYIFGLLADSDSDLWPNAPCENGQFLKMTEYEQFGIVFLVEYVMLSPCNITYSVNFDLDSHPLNHLNRQPLVQQRLRNRLRRAINLVQ